MSRRRFNSAERVALWLAADGRCESCGIELQPGWHADHVNPYSKGGPTDVINGAALCPTCNLKKGTSIMTDPRTRWQQAAEDRFLSSDRENFLITACPGSGKTRAALSMARTLKEAGQIDQIFVVAPTARVQQQWHQAAHAMGLDLTAKYAEAIPRECDGVVITYQRLAAPGNELFYRTLVARSRTLLIADEVHHCSDEDHTRWGVALQTAFEPAVRRLLLSGTPFRTDGARIPFVEYDDNGREISQHRIDYGTAVADGICRSIRFEVMDGRGEWKRGAARFTCDASESDEASRAGLLAALYEPNGTWITTMLRAADEELARMRDEKPDAGALIIAQDIITAKEYARMLTTVTGQHVPVVTSDNDDANVLIDAYRDGTSRWIVAVNMISEGVDIPRLGVLVFASRILTEMWFRQVVGRVTRQDGTPITATMFIPALPELVEMAGRIEAEADRALLETERTLRERLDSEQQRIDVDFVVPLTSSEVLRQQVISAGVEFNDAELRAAMELLSQVGGSVANSHPADIARLLRLAGHAAPVATASVITPPTQMTNDQLRDNLRVQLKKAVNRLVADDPGLDYKKVYYTLNKACGNEPVASATVESLEKRLELIRQWR